MITITVAVGQLELTSYVFSNSVDADNFCLTLKSKGIIYHDNRPIATGINLEKIKIRDRR